MWVCVAMAKGRTVKMRMGMGVGMEMRVCVSYLSQACRPKVYGLCEEKWEIEGGR